VEDGYLAVNMPPHFQEFYATSSPASSAAALSHPLAARLSRGRSPRAHQMLVAFGRWADRHHHALAGGQRVKILGQPVIVENKLALARCQQEVPPLTATPSPRSRWACRLPYHKISWDPIRTSALHVLNVHRLRAPLAWWCLQFGSRAGRTLWRGPDGQPGQAQLWFDRHHDQPAPDDGADRAKLGIELARAHKGSADLRSVGRRRRGRSQSTGFAPQVEAGWKCGVNSTPGAEGDLARKFPDPRSGAGAGPDYQNSPFGVSPRGTPPAVVKRLHDAFKQAMRKPTRVTLARYDGAYVRSTAGYSSCAEHLHA
jgi:hypothetical protein